MTRRPDWDADEREALADVERELDELRARHAGDPHVDLLRAAHHGALPDSVAADVAPRLRESRWSQALVEGMDDGMAALDAASQDRVLRRIQDEAARTAARRRRTRVAWLGLPALAAAVVLVAITNSREWGQPPQTPPAAMPEPRAETSPRPPSFALPLEKAEVRLTPAALTWRAPGPTTFVDDIKAPLDAYRAGDYRRADRLFDTLTPRYPRAVEIPFYQGLSRLLMGEPDAAAELLARAAPLAEGPFVDDVAWYRAVAEERAGNRAGAQQRVEALCRGQGPRAPAACDAAGRMQIPPAPR